MAGSFDVAEALHVSRLLDQQSMDVDYSKYENVKLAAQKRKSAGETNKVRNKKILVSPLRANHSTNSQVGQNHRYGVTQPLSCRKSTDQDRREQLAARRCKTETKELKFRKSLLPNSDFDLDKIKDTLKNFKRSVSSLDTEAGGGKGKDTGAEAVKYGRPVSSLEVGSDSVKDRDGSSRSTGRKVKDAHVRRVIRRDGSPVVNSDRIQNQNKYGEYYDRVGHTDVELDRKYSNSDRGYTEPVERKHRTLPQTPDLKHRNIDSKHIADDLQEYERRPRIQSSTPDSAKLRNSEPKVTPTGAKRIGRSSSNERRTKHLSPSPDAKNRDDAYSTSSTNNANEKSKVSAKQTHEQNSVNKPLADVRRKLDFGKEDIERGYDVLPVQEGPDFTDKIAALRSLMTKDREDKGITDRKAYYDEYRTRSKRVMVSRNDSFKENLNYIDLENDGGHIIGEGDHRYDRLSGSRTHESKQRRAQSADIFRNKVNTGRLSEMDLQVLKERLVDKQKTKDRHPDGRTYSEVDQRAIEQENKRSGRDRQQEEMTNAEGEIASRQSASRDSADVKVRTNGSLKVKTGGDRTQFSPRVKGGGDNGIRYGSDPDHADGPISADEDLLHAADGRTVISSPTKTTSRRIGNRDSGNKVTRKSRIRDEFSDDGLDNDVEVDNEMAESNERPSSRLESKETQTSQLNQSIHSVQSNTPFFEPQGRPLSAPMFNCEVSVGKRKVYKPVQVAHEGIDRGTRNVDSPRQSPRGDGREDRQTNVDSFVGKGHGSPEKQGKNHSPRNIGEVNNIDGIGNTNNRNSERNNVDKGNGDFDNDQERLYMEDSENRRHSRNQRSRSRGSEADAVADDGGRVRRIYSNTNKIRPRSRSGSRHRTQSDNEVKVEHVNRNGQNYSSDLGEKVKVNSVNDLESKSKVNDPDLGSRVSSKSERKVREWIRKQELIQARPSSAPGQPLLLEELNVSISMQAAGDRLSPRRRPASQMGMRPSSAMAGYDRLALEDGGRLSDAKSRNRNFNNSNANPGAIGYIESKHGGSGRLSNRQAISDRLEHISMAVTTQQHQFEVDIPVKKLQACEPVSPKGDHYDCSDTESSVFSLPFSIRSGESISTTVQACKLLRRLYHVDGETRQNLVLMAKCFRRWFNNVLHARVRNWQITQAARPVSPLSYGVMLRTGDVCYRDTLLTRYFTHWRETLRTTQLHNRVQLLHRRHTLQKGMNAFRWAINRSKLQQGILQDRINTMLICSNFSKWRLRAIENRRLRLQQAFQRWRQFTVEAQKIRQMRTAANTQLKARMLEKWRENFKDRLNKHRADRYYRKVVLHGGWVSWQRFTAASKDKKCKRAMATELFQMTLQRKTFTYFKIEFAKYSRAKSFHRRSQLTVALLAWRQGTQVSRTERADDLRVAGAYWSHSSLRSHFQAWRDSLLNNRACRLYDSNTLRDAFKSWHKQCRELVQRRRAVDLWRRNRTMHVAFKHWSEFVSVMKRRRMAAVQCIHSVLQRHTLQRWKAYTQHQKMLRRRMLLHVRKHNQQTQRRCLTLWRAKFKVRCNEKKAQQLWSHSCARKCADAWIQLCHKRKLARLLIDTEPLRQLQTQRVLFLRWRDKMSVITEEKQEASDMRATLDLSQLRQRFDKWRAQTLQLLLIKPMVLRYRARLVTQCFTGWRNYVTHKAECLRCEQAVIQIRLKNKLQAWSRQYQVHQVEKNVRKTCQERRTRKCLQAWRSVIQRKHAAHDFHDKNLQRMMFTHWHTRALRQLRHKQLQQMELESVMSLLREYFERWRHKLYRQQTREDEALTYFQQESDNNRVRAAFYFWRRHFRAQLVARENEKMRIRRLAREALRAWHQYSDRSLHDAVARFAAAIGLQQQETSDLETTDLETVSDELEDRGTELVEALGRGDAYEPMNFHMAISPRSVGMTPRSVGTPKTPRSIGTPRTPITPRTSSSNYGTPFKRLQSPTLSQASLARSLDLEAVGALISSNFLDARFEMEHAVKTESRREIVVTVVHRLRHWPISIMFEQWKEYTSRQREFKRLTTQMISVREKLAQRQHFDMWVNYHKKMRLAKHHYEQVLQHKAVLSLILYRNNRREKKHLNQIAVQHRALRVYQHVFPIWLAKAQERQHTEKILHLWSNITDEERQLIPRERQFRYKLNHKSLAQCFNVWLKKYRRIHKLKKSYHHLLLERYFGAWKVWAAERHERQKKCEQFNQHRTKQLVWKTWCLRHTQRVEVEQRYNDTWHNYMGIILTTWQTWAAGQRRRMVIANHVVAVRNRNLVTKIFQKWKENHQKLTQVQTWQDNRLMTRALHAWREVTAWQRSLKQRQLQCQIMSYTLLAKKMFRQWHVAYSERVKIHEHHELLVQRRVRGIARMWRRKAQVTRGLHLRQHFQTQQVQRFFQQWQCAYNRNLERYQQLDVYISHKNGQLVARYLEQWRAELMCIQAGQVYNVKLTFTLMSAWKQAARGCRERRHILQAYQQKKSRHTQTGYFLYWYNVAKARKSIRGHANLKMQLSVFKAWLLYTRKQINLHRLEAAMTRRRNQRILAKHWYLLKTRFDYCTELADMADKVVQEKNRQLMLQALQHWDFRLKIVIADECHEHILAKRTARKWRCYVNKCKQERHYMQQQMEKAERFYKKALCNKVYRSWFSEVVATRHNEKRRQRICAKYAQLWKHRVDMSFTAKCMRRENQLMFVWQRWHVEFVRRKAILKVEAFERKQQLTMVFVSWKNLSRKRPRKITSLIPLPVSPAFNMPSVTSSCSSPSSDELGFPPYLPSQIAAPSQIPIASQIPVAASQMALQRQLPAAANNSTSSKLTRMSSTGSMDIQAGFGSGGPGSSGLSSRGKLSKTDSTDTGSGSYSNNPSNKARLSRTGSMVDLQTTVSGNFYNKFARVPSTGSTSADIQMASGVSSSGNPSHKHGRISSTGSIDMGIPSATANAASNRGRLASTIDKQANRRETQGPGSSRSDSNSKPNPNCYWEH